MTGPIPPARPRFPSLSNELDHAFGDDIAAEAAVAFLVGLSGKHAGKLFRIKPGESLLGRTSRALVALDEKAVSHQHARLTLTIAGCILTDLGSTNGTYVNDERVSGEVELHAGDVIRLGTSTLGYLTDAEDEGQHTRALARVTQPTIGGHSSAGGHSSVVGHSHPPGMVHIVPAVAGDGAGAMVVTAQGPGGIDVALDYLDMGLDFLRRYRWLLIGSAAFFGVLGVGSMKVYPPRATAEFEILLRQDQTENTAHHFATRGIDYFTTAEHNFTNPDLVRQTRVQMQLPIGQGQTREAIGSLEFQKAGPGVYRGSYKHTESDFAERFLAHHLKNYLEWEIGKSIKVLASEVQLLRTQYEENEASLRELEGSLRDFKSQNLSALPDVATDQMRGQGMLLARRDQLLADSSRLQKEYELARRQLGSEDAFVATNVLKSQPYEEGLIQVRRDIAAANAKGYAQGHPEMQRLKGEEQSLLRLRDSALSQSTTETDRRTNPEHKRLQNRVAELKIAAEAAGQELGQVNERLKEIGVVAGEAPAVEAQMSQKVREVENSKSLHDRLYEQLRAKELELQFERASVEARYDVIKAPRAFPVNLPRSFLLRGVAGIVAGLMLALGIGLVHFATGFVQRHRARRAA